MSDVASTFYSRLTLTHVLLLSFPLIVRAESVMIKRKFTPDSLRYIENAMDIQQKITGSPMGDMSIGVRRVYGVWEKVESVQEHQAQLKMTFDRIAQTMDFPMWGNPRFDSDDPDDPESAALLKQVMQELIGESFTLAVKDGEVASFAGMEEINKKLSKKAIANPFWEQMKSEFTEEAGRRSWGEEPLLIYPNKEVKVGETWKGISLSEHPQIGKTKTEFTYKLERLMKDAGRPTAVISAEGVLSSVPDGEKPDPNAASVTGTVKGEAFYDVKEGLVVSDRYTIDSQIKMPLPGTQGAEGGPTFLDIKIKIDAATANMTPKEREAQKLEARKKAEARAKAQADDEEDEDQDGDDDNDNDDPENDRDDDD